MREFRARTREWIGDIAIHIHDQDEELWGSVTAGDDDVSFVSEDIADNSPYTLDELEDLIPAHPRCRSKPVPWFDLRYAGEFGLRTRAQEEADALTVDYDPADYATRTGSGRRAARGQSTNTCSITAPSNSVLAKVKQEGLTLGHHHNWDPGFSAASAASRCS